MSARAPIAAALVALLGLAVSRVHAQAPTPDANAEPIEVALEGHPGCGDREAFLRQVLARTPRARRARPGEAPRSFAIQIVERAPNSIGTLTIRDAAGGSSQREVTAATCDEVIAALALVAALTIDPQAATTPIPAPSELPPTSPPEATPRPAPTPSAPPPPKTAPPRRAPEAPAPTHESKPPPVAPAPREPRPRLRAQAAVEVMSGIAPSIVVLPRALIELEVPVRGSRWLVPSVRLSAAHGEGSGSVAGVGNASFAWTGGRLELCPVRASAAGFYARPCAAFDAAALRARGEDVEMPRSATRPWLAALLLARGGWEFPFGLGVELYGGAGLPLITDNFEFDDRRNEKRPVIHHIPAVTFTAGLALGMSGEVF